MNNNKMVNGALRKFTALVLLVIFIASAKVVKSLEYSVA